MYLLIGIAFIAIIYFLILFHRRKKKIICRINDMSRRRKSHLLNELAAPLGYWYDSWQEIFSSLPDSWQKPYGYSDIYDRAAPLFNMIFDCQPVYFNYDGKTWLIEFWKGQYGINTGGEIGIYHADHFISPSMRKQTMFHAVEEEEYLQLSSRLCKNGHPIARVKEDHWWLTIFSMGCFSHPEELSLDISIQFPDLEMRDAFLDAIVLKGYDWEDFCICHTTVSFTFRSAMCRRSPLKKLYRCYVQCKNRLFCRLYCFVTRPFQNTCDKLLYLYYYMPFAFRRMLRLRRYR